MQDLRKNLETEENISRAQLAPTVRACQNNNRERSSLLQREGTEKYRERQEIPKQKHSLLQGEDDHTSLASITKQW